MAREAFREETRSSVRSDGAATSFPVAEFVAPPLAAVGGPRAVLIIVLVVSVVEGLVVAAVLKVSYVLEAAASVKPLVEVVSVVVAAAGVVGAASREVVGRGELVGVVGVVGVPRVGAGVGAAGVLCGRETAALTFLLLTLLALLVSAGWLNLV